MDLGRHLQSHGNTLASCSHDSLIRLWDVQTIDFEQSILQTWLK